MKTKRLPLLIALICSGFLFGQNQKMNLGIQGGPSATFLWGNSVLDPFDQIAANFSAGLTFQYHLNQTFSLYTDLAFARKGNKVAISLRDDQGYEVGKTDIHAVFEYLTLPLLARVSFGEDIKFFVNGGPYFGFLLQQSFVQKAVGEYPETKTYNDDLFKTVDFGACVGIGLTIPIAKAILFSIELRNNLGLMNISSEPVVNDDIIATNATDLLVGFSYQFGRVYK